ncbi:MAG: type II toxin-antitoxin system RelE/ParE family toxin [Candidatus Altiarchaeota archaeon]|nr:type II toxin-antitoxin system RelE/ParE family toxin [Candidatus Altiarchaeota archaeon]MBU4266926.1 type II toxin-antitoxin system RelE/ParE family toxin [Candidatus Altiarchaeota archaeon]MBU4341535.1 type II toxin-antitoxin system RelE/ParE family toxin [Candidatus Altiarchaeota archaeon]MBU4437361.1 type II toxin-antitoxin system RelE/ParE family toxin [Candidatus Altiarchaeota archaeon]
MYAVEISQRSLNFLGKLDRHLKERIEDRLRKLATTQISSDTKFICRDRGEKVFRCRIGDYRALYKVKHKDKRVLVTKIEKRPKAY